MICIKNIKQNDPEKLRIQNQKNIYQENNKKQRTGV